MFLTANVPLSVFGVAALPKIGMGSKPVISRKWTGERFGAIALDSHDFKSVCDRFRKLTPRMSSAYRYLFNRPNRLDYQGAIDSNLPIGSGEIESGHRYVIQNRLKLAGSWWTIENVKAMLALRICRTNQDWDAYWLNLSSISS